MLPFYLLFFFTMILGSLIAVNSSSWMVAWIGLEVNLLSILPLMASEKVKGASESCVKYFLVQSMASLIVLVSSMFMFSSILFDNFSVLFVGLGIKLGVVPFHFWFPIVMEGVGWWSCMLLMTWQKLAPLFLMSFVKIFLFVVVITSLVGAMGGFSQLSMSKILAFSSINHVGWMMAGMLSSVWVSLVYYMIYFLLSVLVVLSLVLFKMFSLGQSGFISSNLKFILLLNLLSLGGMPPFLGFFPKWLVIEKLLWSFFVLSIVLIFSSLVGLYFYLRVVYPSLLLSYLGGESELGVTRYVTGMLALFFLSSGGVFCFPLLSVM